MSDDLPMGWVKTELGEIAQVEMGQSPSGDATNTEGIGLPLIGGASDFKEDIIKPTRFTSTPTKICEPNDLILCIRATIGKLAFAQSHYCLGRGVAGLRPYNGIDQSWLKYRLVSDAQKLDAAGTGSTFRQIDKSTLVLWEINLPPLNEQRRIVDKLARLGDRQRSARNELNHIPKLIARYKQSVLAAACSGKLTEDWRIKQNLDDSWHTTNLGSLIQNIRYGTSKKCDYTPLLTPVLRIPNIGNGYIIHSDIKYAEFSPNEIESLQLQIGDILIIRSNGSLDLVGKSAIVSESEQGFLYAGYLIRLRPKVEVILPKYLYFHLIEPLTRSEIESRAKSTSGVNNINSQELQSLIFNIPSLEEQKEIVRRVEKMFAKIDKMEEEYQKAVKLCDRLEQATLAKAFRGELVPQDPNDEPASVLLEQVKREKEKGKKGVKSK
jgi:type I restriction enzyme S subunit